MNIVTYFTGPSFDDPPFDKPLFRLGYYDLAAVLQSRGEEFFIARTTQNYKGGNLFASGWRYEQCEFNRYEEQIHADVIFNKGEDFVADTAANVVVRPALEDACTKDKIYTQFSAYAPKSYLVKCKDDLEKAVDDIPTDLVVMKPPNGGGGRGVTIVTKRESRQAFIESPIIVQEFIDTSAGIPGIIEGMHDFRIIMIDGSAILSFVRTPPPGKLIANVSQGGLFKLVDLERIPGEALGIAQEIDGSFAHIPYRLLSVDLARTKKGSWKIIECNAPPALFAAEGDARVRAYQEATADLLQTAARNGCSMSW